MATEYRLESVADFLAVPENKLAECFADFATWLKLARNAAEVEEIMGHGAKFRFDGWVWRDDGLEGVSAVRAVGNDGKHIATFELSAPGREN